MGNCDCLNNDYYLFEDENFSSIKISENTKNNNINKITRFNNKKNEYIFIPDKNISIEKQLNNELLKNKYNLNLNQIYSKNNLIKNSFYTNFKNGNPTLNNYRNNNKRQNLLESIQSKNSDILFESFSISNIDKNNGSLVIDYYQLARRLFDLLNEIRLNPNEHLNYYLNTSNSINKNNIENLTAGDIILWNEKVYLSISNHLMNIENNKNDNLTATDRINKRLNGKYLVNEFNIEGLGTPKVLMSKLIQENLDRLKEIFSDNYFCGAICTYADKDYTNTRTLIYLVNKKEE